MTLWIIFAGLSALALTALLWPLWRRDRIAASRSAYDASVYRDQLDEIEADFERGLIGEREADSAKLEVSRRLLAAADKATGDVETTSEAVPKPSLGVTAGLLLVPAVSLGLYLIFGSPLLPGQPHADRVAAPSEQNSIQALVAKVEERLRANPGDGRGWDVIAPVYMKSRRYRDAAEAYKNATRILGVSASRLSGYAEASILANNGIVSETASKAYEKALTLDPRLLKARFWLAMAKEQDGRFGEAAAAWREMLKHGSENARWRPVVKERLRVAEAKIRGEDAKPPKAPDANQSAEKNEDAAPGPTQEQVAAASQMSAGDRAAMINQMVDGLAARLKDDGKDLKGWLRLVRAYTVLGKRDAAETALADARRNFAGNETALTELKALADSLGL